MQRDRFGGPVELHDELRSVAGLEVLVLQDLVGTLAQELDGATVEPAARVGAQSGRELVHDLAGPSRR